MSRFDRRVMLNVVDETKMQYICNLIAIRNVYVCNICCNTCTLWSKTKLPSKHDIGFNSEVLGYGNLNEWFLIKYLFNFSLNVLLYHNHLFENWKACLGFPFYQWHIHAFKYVVTSSVIKAHVMVCLHLPQLCKKHLHIPNLVAQSSKY